MRDGANDVARTEALVELRSANAVRRRCATLLTRVLEGQSAHFRVRMERLDSTAALIADETRSNYPTLAVPFHSRWRHFEVAGVDLWEQYAAKHFDPADLADKARRARAALDLALVSVLLDAGAGMGWRYPHADSGTTLARSEGLAIASFELVRSGALSSVPDEPMRVDADRLIALETKTLAQAFAVTQTNPLAGLDGRVALLRALGEALRASPEVYSTDAPRPGALYDHFAMRAAATGGALPATDILVTLLETLSPIWPNGATLAGEPLGDTWRHLGAGGTGASRGLLPLHKLSQWLSYSLIEPLQHAGLNVTGIGRLTGLAEYRNGGLFVDAGLLQLHNPEDAFEPRAVGEPLIVEWRGLTVALLDRVLPLVRAHLRQPGLPLTCMLQGGSWSAGRRLAAERREDGGPPIRVASDGTVF